MRIQHNIAALSAYRNLTNNNSMVSKNLEKLSSGYKINRAGDDAAGLAISEKMRAQITGLETAQKNANDGISLIQTAEGALTEVHSMLNRMVELASQSANGTYSNTDRQNLQEEVDALLDEIDRISKSTNFNGTKLLDGSLGTTTTPADDLATDFENVTVTHVADGVQGKDGVKGKFSVHLGDLKVTNNSAATAAGGTNGTIGAGGVKVNLGGANGITISNTGSVAYGSSISGKTLATEWMAAADEDATADGVQVSIDGVKFNVTHDGEGTLTFEMVDKPTSDFTTNLGITMSATVTNGDGSKTTSTVGEANKTNYDKVDINQGHDFGVHMEQAAVAGSDKVYAEASLDLSTLNIEDGTALKIGNETYVFAVGKDSKFTPGGNIIDLTDMEATDGNLAKKAAILLSQAAKGNSMIDVGTTNTSTITLREKDIDYSKNNLEGATSDNRQDADATAWDGLIQKGVGNPDAKPASTTGGLTLQIGDTAEDFNQLTVSVSDMSSTGLKINGINIASQTGAKDAIDKVKAAIDSVSTQRGKLGALQNRLEHTINNLSVTTENITAAESRIRDVDMAKEMMAYTKNNILVQASQAMLAQANQIPQGVLQLLQ